jgi:hypothetical protein
MLVPGDTRDAVRMDARLGCVGDGDDFRLVVDLVRVRQAIIVALDAAMEQRGRFLAVPHDFYWQVLEPDLNREPGMAVASLVDDCDEGCEVVDTPTEEHPFVTSHALKHLGGLLSVLWDLDGVESASTELVVRSGQKA